MDKVQIFYEDENTLLAALREIDNALELSKNELLKDDELSQIEERSTKRLKENLVEDSLIFREYDRYRRPTPWRKGASHYYVDFEYANAVLGGLRGFIVKILEEQQGSDTKEQTFIDKGNPYAGRKLLREILATANRTIEIQDNYPSVEGDDQNLLPIIEPYLQSNPQLKIRILAEKISSSFLSDLKLFTEQYPKRVEIRTHHNSHGRFIILDDSEVYAFGSSLKDLGKKADFVTKITDRTAIDKAIKEFNIWFKEANNPLESKNKLTKPNITFEINEDKFMPWGNQATGFNVVWGFALTLKINNFKNNKPDYVKVKLRANTTDGVWESQHFIFQQTKEEMDKPDKLFEVSPNKITEIGVVLSQDYPEHSAKTQRVPKPDFDIDTVVLIVYTESGIEQEIKIKPSLVAAS